MLVAITGATDPAQQLFVSWRRRRLSTRNDQRLEAQIYRPVGGVWTPFAFARFVGSGL
jgi:hypothetical protein